VNILDLMLHLVTMVLYCFMDKILLFFNNILWFKHFLLCTVHI